MAIRTRMCRTSSTRTSSSCVARTGRASRASVLRVVEEARAGLTAQMARGDEVGEDRRRPPAFLAGLLGALLEDVGGDVEADEVGELERTHRPVEAVLDSKVAVVLADDARLDELERLLHRDEQDAVD